MLKKHFWLLSVLNASYCCGNPDRLFSGFFDKGKVLVSMYYVTKPFYVFTDMFDHFNVPLWNKSINYLKKSYLSKTFESQGHHTNIVLIAVVSEMKLEYVKTDMRYERF